MTIQGRKGKFGIGGIVTALSVLVCFSLMSFSAQAVDGASDVDEIKFPRSQWSQKLLNSIDEGPSILPRDEVFEIAPYPANSSEITKAELSSLQEFAATKRDEETVARIFYENSGAAAATIFKNEGLIDKVNYETISLLTTIDADHFYFILKSKKDFSRPRPSQLDETLDLVIFNPEHAAYPSGHASQAYMVALVLADFDPENAERYSEVNIYETRSFKGGVSSRAEG